MIYYVSYPQTVLTLAFVIVARKIYHHCGCLLSRCIVMSSLLLLLSSLSSSSRERSVDWTAPRTEQNVTSAPRHLRYHGTPSAQWRPQNRRRPATRSSNYVFVSSLTILIVCLVALPATGAWSFGGFRPPLQALYAKPKSDKRGSTTTTTVFDEETKGDDLWQINASGSFGSLLMKMGKRSTEMQEQNQSYVLTDDALEIDPVVGGNRTTLAPYHETNMEDEFTEDIKDDSELLLTALDWEAARQIDESVVRVRRNLTDLLSVREISNGNPLGTVDRAATRTALMTATNISAVPTTRRSATYQRRMDRDQKLLLLQIASSINSVEEWKTVCELTDGVYPLLELILQGTNETSTEQEKDYACRSARTLRDLCALSPELSAVITDDILRANVGWQGALFRSLCYLLEDSQDKQPSKGRNLRPALKKKQETMQLYVAQLLLAISLASDEAVHTIRKTEGLKEAVLGCSSFANKERRRRWLRYPGEIVRWLWKSRKKGVTNLRRPFVEAASIGFDLNGQVQRTANQVLAAIGYNQWVPKIPGQRGLRLLCLDGGGSRGMVAVTAMAALVEAVGLEVSDSFDMLAGTSTGAIISFLVGLRQETSSEAVERYNQLIKQIFVKSSFSTPLLLFTTATYDESPFMNILCKILDDDSMLDSRADPAVPLVFAVTSKMSSTPTHVALLRNYNYATGEFPDSFTVKPEEARAELGIPLDLEHPLIRKSPYKNAPLSSSSTPGKRVSDGSRHPGSFRVLQRYALRASTAAPTVFKPVMMGGEMYCDGGIVASNPAAVAIHEARTLFPNVPIELVVSIGTGGFIEQKSAPRIGWDGIIGQIVDSATDGEQVHHVLEDILGAL